MAFHQINVRPLYLAGGQWKQNFRFVVDAWQVRKTRLRHQAIDLSHLGSWFNFLRNSRFTLIPPSSYSCEPMKSSLTRKRIAHQQPCSILHRFAMKSHHYR